MGNEDYQLRMTDMQKTIYAALANRYEGFNPEKYGLPTIFEEAQQRQDTHALDQGDVILNHQATGQDGDPQIPLDTEYLDSNANR